jgi:hypothetical protein
MTYILILNVVLGAAALAAVIGLLLWSIVTQATQGAARRRRPERPPARQLITDVMSASQEGLR